MRISKKASHGIKMQKAFAMIANDWEEYDNKTGKWLPIHMRTLKSNSKK